MAKREAHPAADRRNISERIGACFRGNFEHRGRRSRVAEMIEETTQGRVVVVVRRHAQDGDAPRSARFARRAFLAARSRRALAAVACGVGDRVRQRQPLRDEQQRQNEGREPSLRSACLCRDAPSGHAWLPCGAEAAFANGQVQVASSYCNCKCIRSKPPQPCTSSPIRWPWVSFTRLKWSMSTTPSQTAVLSPQVRRPGSPPPVRCRPLLVPRASSRPRSESPARRRLRAPLRSGTRWSGALLRPRRIVLARRQGCVLDA